MVVVFVELGSVGDLVTGIVGETPQVITAFLLCKFGMSGGADQECGFGTVKERASVLNVGNPLDRHPTVAVHGKVSGTENLLSCSAKASFVLGTSEIAGDKRSGFELVDNVAQQSLDIVLGIGTDRVHRQIEGSDPSLEQRDGQSAFGN